MLLGKKAARMLLLVLAALTSAQPGAAAGHPSWKSYASLMASEAVLPVRIVVGPSLSLAAAQSQANAVGCGVEVVLSGTIAGNLVLTPRCRHAEQLGIRIRGPATLHGGIRVSCAQPGCGWVSLEQLSVVSTRDDAYDVDSYGRMAVINGTGRVSGAFSNVLTAHNDSQLLALNTSGTSLGSDRASPVSIIQRAHATLIGEGTFTSASAPRDEVVSLGGESTGGAVRITLIGHRLVCLVQHGCPVEALLAGRHRTVTWRMLRDRLAGLTLVAPGAGARDLAFDIDSIHGVSIGLAVPVPAWVDGVGAAAVTVAE
jgi:hypothetical protein